MTHKKRLHQDLSRKTVSDRNAEMEVKLDDIAGILDDQAMGRKTKYEALTEIQAVVRGYSN